MQMIASWISLARDTRILRLF